MAIRIDRIEAPQWDTSKFELTPEGYLKGTACVTQIGVFPYMMADGTIVHELRLPEEVFSEDSLASYELKPITNEHPDEAVDSKNIKKYQVGNLGTKPINKNNVYVTVDMIIQDAETIKQIMAGKQELSCGYSLELEKNAGVWGGIKYDAIQRKIQINHVAVVDKARAGDAARIRLDSADEDTAVLYMQNEKVIQEEDSMPSDMTVKIDASEVQEVLKAVTAKADALQVEVNTLTVDKSKAEAERDTLKDKVDGLEKKVAELEANKLDEAVIKAAVDRRVKILDAARKAGIEIKEDASELDVQKAVIMKVFPKANLDGKDQVYLDARFDGALETFEANADAEVRKANADEVKTDKQDSREVPDSGKAREKMIADLRARSKKS